MRLCLLPLAFCLLSLSACRSTSDTSESPGPPQAADSLPPLFARVDVAITRLEPDVIALRRDFHRHPELSGNEARTAARVAEALLAAGYSVRTGVGGHGVVGRLTGGKPGPLVALRADMDAFPSNVPDPVAEIASVTPGVRHICGHDVHTAVGVGVAQALASVRADLAGSVLVLFQPAEERATGARAMLAAGALADGLPAAIFAFHTAPLEVGQIGTKPGPMLGARGTPEAIAAGLPGTAPGVTNHEDLEGRMRPVIRALVGEPNLRVSTSVVPGFSEDFGHFQALVPGVMYWLGVSNTPRGTAGMPHSDEYVADEGAIRVGMRVMSALLLQALQEKPPGE